MSDLKNRKRIGTSVDLEVWDSFEKLAEKTKIPKSKLFDEALKDIVKKYEPLTCLTSLIQWSN